MDFFKNTLPSLWSFLNLTLSSSLQVVLNRCGRFIDQTISLEDSPGLLESGSVRDSGAGGNDIQGVSDDIRKDESDDSRRKSPAGKPASLHLRDMFPDGIDLLDIRSAI